MSCRVCGPGSMGQGAFTGVPRVLSGVRKLLAEGADIEEPAPASEGGYRALHAAIHAFRRERIGEALRQLSLPPPVDQLGTVVRRASSSALDEALAALGATPGCLANGQLLSVPLNAAAFDVDGAVFTGRQQIAWIGQLAKLQGLYLQSNQLARLAYIAFALIYSIGSSLVGVPLAALLVCVRACYASPVDGRSRTSSSHACVLTGTFGELARCVYICARGIR